MSIPLPKIAVNGMSTLKPELIGLAAWLSATQSNLLVSDRRRILEHVGECGVLGDQLPCPMSQEEVAAANAAHRDWLDYLAATDSTPVRPLITSPKRNGHRFQLPPISGGAPVSAADDADLQARFARQIASDEAADRRYFRPANDVDLREEERRRRIEEDGNDAREADRDLEWMADAGTEIPF